MFEIIKCKDRDDWLRSRKLDLTASVAPALWGIHPYLTEYELFYDKMNKLPERASNQAMLGGRYFEVGVVNYLKDLYPTWKFDYSSQGYTYYRDPQARLGATPDLIVENEKGLGVIQIKTTSYANYKRSWLSEDVVVVPDWIQIQTLIEAHLVGASWAAVALCVVDPFDVYLIDVERKDGLIEAIKNRVAKFWRDIENGQAPPPNYSRDGETIKKVEEPQEGKTIDLSSNNRIVELVSERVKNQKLKKQAEDIIKTIDAEVAHILGDASEGVLKDDKKICWVTRLRKGFIVEPSTTRSLKYPKIEEV